jgi:hypothetical protein
MTLEPEAIATTRLDRLRWATLAGGVVADEPPPG